MTLQKQTDGASGLIVTANFVEAEDIADALRRSGFADVVHCRDVSIAMDHVGQDARAHTMAFLSFSGQDDQFEVLLALLHKAGTHSILINGDPSVAENLGTAFLRRPFSEGELDHAIERAMAGY